MNVCPSIRILNTAAAGTKITISVSKMADRCHIRKYHFGHDSVMDCPICAKESMILVCEDAKFN